MLPKLRILKGYSGFQNGVVSYQCPAFRLRSDCLMRSYGATEPKRKARRLVAGPADGPPAAMGLGIVAAADKRVSSAFG